MISILCVSDCKERAQPFIADMSELAERLGAEFLLARDGIEVKSAGYIESVLDEAIALTKGDWILRLDDDERVSKAMERWLMRECYLRSDHWSFPRVHFWRDTKTVITDRYYWPDVQTRFSKRAKAGGVTKIHQPSPYGGGLIAPVCIEHHVYLVKTYEERLATSIRYQQIAADKKIGESMGLSGNLIVVPGDGGEFRACSFEDEKRGQEVKFTEYNGGFVNAELYSDSPFEGCRTWKETL